MNKIPFILLLLVGFWATGKAQQRLFDIPTTEVLIGHNKRNYDQHKESKKKQLKSQATVTWWKTTTDKFKKLTTEIDKRLTSFKAITQDASVMLDLYIGLQHIYDYQKKVYKLAIKNPQAGLMIMKQEKSIYRDGEDLLRLVALVAMSYGDINKMKASNRLVIINTVRNKINNLVSKSSGFYFLLSMIDFQRRFKTAKPERYYNQDKRIVEDILKNMDL